MAAHDIALDCLRDLIAEETDECIEWPWGRLPSGYGCWRQKKHTEYAHRWALKLTVGEPLSYDCRLALHSCRNPPCVNPRHLRWGTVQDNMADRQKHGAWHESMKKRRLATVDPQKVTYVRWWSRSSMTDEEVGLMFQVSPTAVRRIRRGSRD